MTFPNPMPVEMCAYKSRSPSRSPGPDAGLRGEPPPEPSPGARIPALAALLAVAAGSAPCPFPPPHWAGPENRVSPPDAGL
jgi:hypothetical protein